MIRDYLIIKNLKGSSHDLIIPYWHLSVVAGLKYAVIQGHSGYPVSRPRSESSTSRIQVQMSPLDQCSRYRHSLPRRPQHGYDKCSGEYIEVLCLQNAVALQDKFTSSEEMLYLCLNILLF
jgi:hypothetical protein